MIIFLWLASLVLFVTSIYFLTRIMWSEPKFKEAVETIMDGFFEALKGCGFNIKKPKPTPQLWIWEVVDEDGDICEGCIEKTYGPPMEMADWLAQGLPEVPPEEKECGHECRCQLVPYEPNKYQEEYYHETE